MQALKFKHLVQWVGWFIAFCLCLPGLPAAGQPPIQGSLQSQAIIVVPGPNQLTLAQAISQAKDGDTIQIEAGVYPTPAEGFSFSQIGKSLRLRAAPGAVVVLDGGQARRILTIQNSAATASNHTIFQGLIFANGLTTADGVAAVTLYHANVTFIDCSFQNNYKRASPSATAGAALLAVDQSNVFITHSTFSGNRSENGGAALMVRSSRLYLHASRLIDNHAIAAVNHATQPPGGAINAGDAVVRISNSLFEDNTAVNHGGAIWGIGSWSAAQSPDLDLLIVNSTFRHNQALDHAVPGWDSPNGGAINIEGHALLRVYHGRFLENNAMQGGAITLYQAQAELHHSLFQGNWTTHSDPSVGMGGALLFQYGNHPEFARLSIANSLLQGRSLAQGGSSLSGGCLATAGTPAGSLPLVQIQRSTFYDCDVREDGSKGGAGGGMTVAGVDLHLQEVQVLFSDAAGTPGSLGGALIIYPGAQATIASSAFAYNSAISYGGNLFAQGSTLNIQDSLFSHNEISPGTQEPLGNSYGAALFSGPGGSQPMQGSLVNNWFDRNAGLAIFDLDNATGATNQMQYNGNQFYETRFGDKVYQDSLAAAVNGSGLNALVIQHGSQGSLAKSPAGGNASLTRPPAAAFSLVLPGEYLPDGSGLDASDAHAYFLSYAWSGQSASLGGRSLPALAGLAGVLSDGTLDLNFNGTAQPVSLPSAVRPLLTLQSSAADPGDLTAAPGAASCTWNLRAGELLDIAMDGGLSIPVAASGSVSISGLQPHHVYALTAQGGAWAATDDNPTLAAPDQLTYWFGLDEPRTRSASVRLLNLGGGVVDWSASLQGTPRVVQAGATSGSLGAYAELPLTINTSQQAAGTLVNTLNIQAGTAGSTQTPLNIHIVAHVYRLYTASLLR